MLHRLLWRPVLKSFRPPIRKLSAVTLELQSQIHNDDVGKLSEIWQSALSLDRQSALELRYDVYQRMRLANFETDAEWSLAILSVIPKQKLRLADYQYVVELLLHTKRWRDLYKTLTDLAPLQPTLWEPLFLWLLAHADEGLTAHFTLEALAVSCIGIGLELDELAVEPDSPVFEMLSQMATRFGSEQILEALTRLAKDNMVMAASMGSSLLALKCDRAMHNAEIPGPQSQEGAPLTNDLPTQLWLWKTQRKVASTNDLRMYMLYLVYKRRAADALKVYDEHPKLRDPKQSDAVLIAAAADSDFSRLQRTFEQTEREPSIVAKMGSRRYATVLRALGYLGNAGVLDEVYQRLLKKTPDLLSRGVFHALIQSHGLRGDLVRARAFYDSMLQRGIFPNRTTFKLVLGAYKDAKDLRGALQFVGDEMIAKHQLGLKNPELTVLLALCALRHDIKSAEYVWEWGTSICAPDQTSWHARMQCYAQVNALDTLWSMFEEYKTLFTPAIESVTVLLQAAARFDAPEYASKVFRVKQELKLAGDDAWYVSVMQYHSRANDLVRFDETLREMRSNGLRLNASHYALYTEVLGRTKNFNRAKKLPAHMAKNRVPITHGFIGKHFRMLTAPGSTIESSSSAEETALHHVKEGYFDPQSAMVPRGTTPVINIKPVVRRLIKQRNYLSAKQLLDSVRSTRGSVRPNDSYQLWALYIELAHSTHTYSTVDKLWVQFMRDLTKVFVLEQGASAPGQRPVYKLAARHRHTFWKTVDAKLDSMAYLGDLARFTEFPQVIEKQGLEMTSSNWNTYVQGLIRLEEPDQAFKAAQAISARRMRISRQTWGSLSTAVDVVDIGEYGLIGEKARALALRISNSEKIPEVTEPCT